MIAILIPAFNPPRHILQLVKDIRAKTIHPIFLVNDGSAIEYAELFQQLAKISNVSVIPHSNNRGKGAALKTGLSFIYTQYSMVQTVITADADGQHHVDDILKIIDESQANKHLIIGVRTFEKNAPFRSKLGNVITRILFKRVIGYKVSDTQSGLRGIPRMLIPDLLLIKSNGYEFELDMLIKCKQLPITIKEIPIATIYIENNKDSHFNPFVDSLKIYFVLFRFSICSLLTVVIDYLIFFILNALGVRLIYSLFGARAISLFFNYPLVKTQVFNSKDSNRSLFPSYLFLVVVSGLCAYCLMHFLIRSLNVPTIPAKVIAELIIYFANFTIQRDFIFFRGREIKTSLD